MLIKKIGVSVAFFATIFATSLSFSCKENNNENPVDKNNVFLKSSHERSTGIEWITFADGIKRAKEEKKYIIVDFYTDDCTYCEKMEVETYTDKKLIEYFNSKFVSIKVNAESDKKIFFDGKQVTEKQLAMGFGVENYPTLFFMSGEKESIGNVPGFINAKELYNLATYVATDAYKDKTFEQYLKSKKT